MIALTRTDKCFSTISGNLARVFNTDGRRRNELNVDEVRTAFDFEILKKPSYDENGRRIPAHFHVVRSDNNDFIPSSGLGKKFVPIQHIDIFNSVINEIIPLANEVIPNMPKMVLETVGTLHGGGTGICTVRVGDYFTVPSDTSRSYIRLVFANPCNGRGSIIIGCSIVREDGQIQVPVACGGFSVHHTKNANIHLSNAMKCVVGQIEEAQKVISQIYELGATAIQNDDSKSFLDDLISEIHPFTYKQGTPGYTRQFNVRSEVLSQYYGGEVAMSMTGNSAWKVFCAFTYPIFNPSSLGKNLDYADIFYRSMVGGRRHALKKIFGAVYGHIHS